jgi:hypothetical protein
MRQTFGFVVLVAALVFAPERVSARVEYFDVLTTLYPDAKPLFPRDRDAQKKYSFCHSRKLKRFRNEFGAALLKQLGEKKVTDKLRIKAAVLAIEKDFPELAAAHANDLRAGHFETHYEPSTEQGELAVEANYFLWIPEGVTKLRGIIVHQHGCGDGAEKGGVTASHDLHWQALARKWDCALMGSSYRAKGESCRLWCDPRKGSNKAFLQAIGDFVEQSHHKELAEVPWCLWGHSGGAFWSSLMQTEFPERIVAIWLRSGTAFGYWEKGEIEKPVIPETAYQIPVMCNPGAKERDDDRFRVAWDGGMDMFKAYRSKGAPIGFAPDPNTAHECGDSRYLAIPFFDACLAQRLPKADAPTRTLRAVWSEESWLVSPLGTDAAPAGKFPGDPKAAVWLPNEAFAKSFLEYTEHGSATDTTPPPVPHHLAIVKGYSPATVTLTWQAEADFESGLQQFIILRDGVEMLKFPEEPENRFGRPLFQGMSYHDTPTEPLQEMKLVFSKTEMPAGSKLQVISVNSVQLRSSPSKVVVVP